MENCLWVCAGYPVLTAAIAVLWVAYGKSEKRYRQVQEKRLEEKETHVKELETFKRMIQERDGGGKHGYKSL